jgi:hypothetical protein
MDNLNVRGLFGTLERFATKHREENSLPAWEDLSMYQEYWGIEAICKNNRVDDARKERKAAGVLPWGDDTTCKNSKSPQFGTFKKWLVDLAVI